MYYLLLHMREKLKLHHYIYEILHIPTSLPNLMIKYVNPEQQALARTAKLQTKVAKHKSVL